MVERHVVVKHFVYQECLSYTAATIYSDKLSSTAMVIAVEFCDFLFSSYNVTHKQSLLIACKVTIILVKSKRK